ncbi:DUF1648 domain-containing protein [Kitasatospora sp. NPDC087861]|uniref:DUF1648 domain-containing protein n=1 Tax=Kitasatospora sp. NPDC087861 TaxID=3364070 RepID=UPI0037F9AD74
MTDEGPRTNGRQGKGRRENARRGNGPQRGAVWGAAAWSAGVLGLLIALPWAARSRLPDRLATHWSGRNPDGAMSLTAAALFPAATWLVLVLATAAAFRFWPARSRGATGVTLATGGVLLTGAQTSIVHANLDRARWQDAAPMGVEVVLIIAAAGLAGLLTWLATRPHQASPAGARPATGATVPAAAPGEQLVWLSRAVNPWLQLAAAVLGLGAVGGVLAPASGLIALNWSLIVPFASTSVLVLACSSVQARVTDRGLSVGFGPFGWPSRRWSPADLESARAETRTPAQAGGWGYRINGLGTTVMLRRGVCLVVRTRRGGEFAVSVDDAERGAALLDSLISRAASPTG